MRRSAVGISVDSATDVTKPAADIVLLEKDLGVLARGVTEGRQAFANTLKYIFITTSANFGNMFSMAGASFFATRAPRNYWRYCPHLCCQLGDDQAIDDASHWDVTVWRSLTDSVETISQNPIDGRVVSSSKGNHIWRHASSDIPGANGRIDQSVDPPQSAQPHRVPSFLPRLLRLLRHTPCGIDF